MSCPLAHSMLQITEVVARLKEEARALGCTQIQLISHVKRESAHRFYVREGFGIECFEFGNQLVLFCDAVRQLAHDLEIVPANLGLIAGL